jgi:hypothetical protein
MAKSERSKIAGSLIERDRKVQKLTRMIKGKERDVELLDRRLAVAKARVANGETNKGEFQRLNIDIMRRRKGVRSTITKLERQRLNRERALKEKAEEKEEKLEEKEERRKEREEKKAARLREKQERKRKDAAPKGDDP